MPKTKIQMTTETAEKLSALQKMFSDLYLKDHIDKCTFVSLSATLVRHIDTGYIKHAGN